jgi:integrase
MRSPFTLFKKLTQTGLVWYARFWNEKTAKYSVCRSTGVIVSGKKGRQKEAWDAAMMLLPDLCFDEPEVKHTVAETPFLDYVTSFWKEGSDYITDCASIKKKPLSRHYIRGNADDTRLHLAPYKPFQKITLGELTTGHIRAWMRWAAENGRSSRRINAALSAMRIAVRYAVSNEDLEKDPFRNVIDATENPKEVGILSHEEVLKLINSPVTNAQYRAVVLLAVLCSMRRGEIRGLKWGDMEGGIINLTHNFVDLDGLKGPKRDSYRKIPLPRPVEVVLGQVKDISMNTEPDDYVFESLTCPGQPLGETFFRNAFSHELEGIGIPGKWMSKKPMPEGYVDEQQRRNLKLHGLRHDFVTLGRLSGISDMEIQALAGHKSGRMMEHYSHADQVLDLHGIKVKLEQAYKPKDEGGAE